MKQFTEFVAAIENEEHRQQFITILQWVEENYPNLEGKIAWNQPMFTDHGTFIIGFSVAKNHFAFAPEQKTVDIFRDEVTNAGYEATKKFFKIKWVQDVDYQLLKKIIDFNIEDKKDETHYWRQDKNC